MSYVDFYALTPAFAILVLAIFGALLNLKEPKVDKQNKNESTLL